MALRLSVNSMLADCCLLTPIFSGKFFQFPSDISVSGCGFHHLVPFKKRLIYVSQSRTFFQTVFSSYRIHSVIPFIFFRSESRVKSNDTPFTRFLLR